MKKRLVSLLIFVVSGGVFASETEVGKALTISAGKGFNQYFCAFGEVYKKETDKCVSVFQETERVTDDITKTAPDIHVISMITIKKGDTCMKVTKYSLNDCIKLGRKYGRMPSVFIAMDNSRTFYVPLYVGEQIAYVRITNEDKTTYTTYILPQKK